MRMNEEATSAKSFPSVPFSCKAESTAFLASFQSTFSLFGHSTIFTPWLLLLDFQIKFNWKRSLFYYWYFAFSIISIKLSILAKDSIEIFFYLLFIYFEFQ